MEILNKITNKVNDNFPNHTISMTEEIIDSERSYRYMCVDGERTKNKFTLTKEDGQIADDAFDELKKNLKNG